MDLSKHLLEIDPLFHNFCICPWKNFFRTNNLSRKTKNYQPILCYTMSIYPRHNQARKTKSIKFYKHLNRLFF